MSGLKNWVGNRNGISNPVQSAINGASHTTSPAANSRRQLLAAQAHMPPPPTRLARQPLQAPVHRPETRHMDSVAPNHVESEDRPTTVGEQFDSQDHFGGAFDTDIEGMDESSLLSEVQVKDSQVNGRDTAPIPILRDTGPPGGGWNHAMDQADNNQHDAAMGNYENYNAEGNEDGEASGLEEEEDTSDDEDVAQDEDPTVVSMMARELEEMRADPYWRPLVERPKNPANIINQQKQTNPERALRHLSKPYKQALEGARNIGSSPHDPYSDITSGESDPDEEHNEISRKKAQGPPNRQNEPHESRKRPGSQPKVVRVSQGKQPQMRSPPAQQPCEEVRDRPVKQEQPLNHQHASKTVSQPPKADETDHPEEIKPDPSNTKNNNNTNNNEPPPPQTAPPPSPTTLLPNHPPPPRTKRRPSLDYPPTTLRTMPYTTLRTQPFDHDPHPPSPPLPSPLLSAPLPAKLQHITSLPDADRTTFFATLPLADWEDAGDWFVDRFGALVAKMREARTERRRVAAEFEDEIARREEYVRRSREGVEGEMRKMRRGGEDVLRGGGS